MDPNELDVWLTPNEVARRLATDVADVQAFLDDPDSIRGLAGHLVGPEGEMFVHAEELVRFINSRTFRIHGLSDPRAEALRDEFRENGWLPDEDE